MMRKGGAKARLAATAQLFRGLKEEGVDVKAFRPADHWTSKAASIY